MSKFNLSLFELNRLTDGLCDSYCIGLHKCEGGPNDNCNVILVTDSDGELTGELRDGFYSKLSSIHPYMCDNCEKRYCKTHAVIVVTDKPPRIYWTCYLCMPEDESAPTHQLH